MHLIYVCGSNRSGTSLLKRMFHTFDGAYVVPKETPLKHLESEVRNSPSSTLVLKPMPPGWLRMAREEHEERRAQALALADTVSVVYCYRDVRSWIRNAGPKRVKYWLSAAREAQRWASDIAVWVRFEDLVSNPDPIQDRIAKTLGLTWRARFSDYPSFLPSGWGEQDQMHRGHRVRNLEIDPTAHTHTLEEISMESGIPQYEFESALRFYGYSV